MARVTFSSDDILRSKLLPPGFYPILVKSFATEQAGTDGSDLYVYEIRVDGGEYSGVPIRFQISEKALGMGIEFLESCGIEVKQGVPVELDKVVGKKLDGFVQRGNYKGRDNNSLVSFRQRKTTGGID